MSGTSRPARIAVLDYGIGNLASAQKAFRHVGADAELTASPAHIAAADAVVLPGVGAFGSCMEAIARADLIDIARSAAGDGRPFLGICIGMQMMFESSTESPGVDGLGILTGHVDTIGPGVKLPQMQWNTISAPNPKDGLAIARRTFDGCDQSWMYFVHSYAAVASSTDAAVVATCDYGGPVVAAVAANNVLAMQFHPEKSGSMGLRLLRNFANFVASTRGDL